MIQTPLPGPPTPPPTAWDHAAAIVGSLAAIAVGGADLLVFGQHLTAAVDTGLVLAGLAGLGVKGAFTR